jgi:hypothetical protein
MRDLGLGIAEAGELVLRQIQREAVECLAGGCGVADADKFAGKEGGGNGDAQESESGGEVVLECEPIPFSVAVGRVHGSSRRRRRIVFEATQIWIAAGAGDDERHLPERSIHSDVARVTFVQVSVAGENGVGHDAGLCACVVNIGQHFRAGSVLRAPGKRRVMDSEKQRALKAVFSVGGDLLELGDQKVLLILADDLVGNQALGVAFPGVGIEADDSYKRRFQREIDAGLGHRGARDSYSFGSVHGTRRAELFLKRGQRFRRRRGGRFVNDGVMIAGDGEYRRGVIAVGIVELIVVVLRLAEEVDDVSKMVEKSRAGGRIGGFKVVSHLVGNEKLVRGSLDSSRVADAVKGEAVCVRVEGAGGKNVAERHHRRAYPRRRNLLDYLIGFERGVRGEVGLAKAAEVVRRNLRVGEGEARAAGLRARVLGGTPGFFAGGLALSRILRHMAFPLQKKVSSRPGSKRHEHTYNVKSLQRHQSFALTITYDAAKGEKSRRDAGATKTGCAQG